MKICVYGLSHLGCVTAACLAAKGWTVVGLDADASVVRGLAAGQPPLFEPGLPELVRQGLDARRLSFTSDIADATRGADVVWVCFDSPIDDEDRADVDYVRSRIERLFAALADGAVVVVSSQMPVGTVADLARRFAPAANGRTVAFACSPENLRLGKSIDSFLAAQRIVVGVDEQDATQRTRRVLEPILTSLCPQILWMSIESAEMAKHALNAFLATSVTFANEIATICERVGARAADVERALRSEPRVGPSAYLRPGAAFAGGTLARDVVFLTGMAQRDKAEAPLLGAILASNLAHRRWPMTRLAQQLGSLGGRTIAILGLSYKPGTDSLRRSTAVELIRWLGQAGAQVRAVDPVVRALPPDAPAELCGSVDTALAGADAMVVATEWPEFAAVSADQLVGRMRRPLVIDANGFLRRQCAGDRRIEYVTVGSQP